MKKLWSGPDVVMLFFSAGAYVTLPTNQVPAEALRFLKDKALQSGAPVDDRTGSRA